MYIPTPPPTVCIVHNAHAMPRANKVSKGIQFENQMCYAPCSQSGDLIIQYNLYSKQIYEVNHLKLLNKKH